MPNSSSRRARRATRRSPSTGTGFLQFVLVVTVLWILARGPVNLVILRRPEGRREDLHLGARPMSPPRYSFAPNCHPTTQSVIPDVIRDPYSLWWPLPFHGSRIGGQDDRWEAALTAEAFITRNPAARTRRSPTTSAHHWGDCHAATAARNDEVSLGDCHAPVTARKRRDVELGFVRLITRSSRSHPHSTKANTASAITLSSCIRGILVCAVTRLPD